jgi:hypothetical protein
MHCTGFEPSAYYKLTPRYNQLSQTAVRSCWNLINFIMYFSGISASYKQRQHGLQRCWRLLPTTTTTQPHDKDHNDYNDASNDDHDNHDYHDDDGEGWNGRRRWKRAQTTRLASFGPLVRLFLILV